MELAKTFHRWSGALVDLVLPARCLKCLSTLGQGGEGLCPGCWTGLRWIGEPACACCGAPFEFAADSWQLCGQCMAERPGFASARAALAYDEASRDLVLRFKHADRTDAAPVLAAMMARAGAALLAGADVIAPVPLHWTRLWSRRYNQAAMLAQILARRAGKPFIADLLTRRRKTPSQGHLGRGARKANVAGAFAVKASRAPLIEGRAVLLVDDVMTTGATVDACARTLTRAGAKRADVLTFARALID